MGRLFLRVICCSILFTTSALDAGIRAPGKYNGVVIYDRWDACTLYRGISLMYVSEKTKSGLRDYSGQAVLIDAKEVDQPINPGDGLIGKFEYLGPAPADNRRWVPTNGLAIRSSVEVDDAGQAIASIILKNSSDAPLKLLSQELALTLLIKRNPSWFTPADGLSIALITRQSFEIGGDEPRWSGSGLVEEGKPYTWTIGKENALPHDFVLESGEEKKIDIHFQLPDGEYDFLCGYGSRCLASNLSAFDVIDGKATIVTPNGRPSP